MIYATLAIKRRWSLSEMRIIGGMKIQKRSRPDIYHFYHKRFWVHILRAIFKA